MKLTFNYLAPLALLLTQAAHAQVPVQQIRLGTPSYAGTGCPIGSASATLSPDGQSLSILFDNFQAEAGGNSGNTIDRKACDIAIPVGVPSGYTVSVIKTDFRGYNNIPVNGSATFDVEYFFAGQTGPAFHKSFVGGSDGDFTLSNDIVATSLVWSACGADVNLRTNTSIAIQTNAQNQEALFTIDSADITSGVVYQLQWKTCNSGPGVPNPPTPPAPTPFPTPYQPYPTPYPTPYQPYPTPYPTPYQPYPTPYPTPIYNPPPVVGACTINSYNDARGFLTYTVTDGYGRLLVTTMQYAQAINVAQQGLHSGSCSSIVNNASGPGTGPYPPQPPFPGPGRGPGPGPWQPPGSPLPPAPGRQSYCQVAPGGNSMGQQFYRVIDRMGRILYNTPNYNQASQEAQTDPRCFQ